MGTTRDGYRNASHLKIKPKHTNFWFELVRRHLGVHSQILNAFSVNQMKLYKRIRQAPVSQFKEPHNDAQRVSKYSRRLTPLQDVGHHLRDKRWTHYGTFDTIAAPEALIIQWQVSGADSGKNMKILQIFSVLKESPAPNTPFDSFHIHTFFILVEDTKYALEKGD